MAFAASVTHLSAYAHTQRTAITTILFNTRTDMLEVMHRFDLHDAEHAVGDILGKSADILSSKQTQADFAAYVASRFTIIADNSEGPLALTLVGQETDGNFIWIYQEATAPSVESLSIGHEALRDIWPDQVNTVNVEGGFGVKSAQFDGRQQLARIRLRP